MRPAPKCWLALGNSSEESGQYSGQTQEFDMVRRLGSVSDRYRYVRTLSAKRISRNEMGRHLISRLLFLVLDLHPESRQNALMCESSMRASEHAPRTKIADSSV